MKPTNIVQKVFTDTILLSTSQQLKAEKEVDHWKGQYVPKIKLIHKLLNNQLVPTNNPEKDVNNSMALVTNTTINDKTSWFKWQHNEYKSF